jgi:hypothetical protein
MGAAPRGNRAGGRHGLEPNRREARLPQFSLFYWQDAERVGMIKMV